MSDYSDVQNRIGYRFTDSSLLEIALTHTSFVNEHGGSSNERLEFLGDSLLNFLVARALVRRSDIDEGEMSEKRAQTVSRKPLAAAVEELGLLKFLRVGAGVDVHSFSVKCRSNLFEALLGAIYLDCNDIEICDAFLERALYPYVQPDVDYKSRLQLLAARSVIAYETNESLLGDCFVSKVSVDGRVVGEGSGKRKKDAEHAAAKNALRTLK